MHEHHTAAALIGVQRQKIAQHTNLMNADFAGELLLGIAAFVFRGLIRHVIACALSFRKHLLKVRMGAGLRQPAAGAVSAGGAVRMGRKTKERLGKGECELIEPRTRGAVQKHRIGHPITHRQKRLCGLFEPRIRR